MQGKAWQKVREQVHAEALSYIEHARAFLAHSAAEHELTEIDLAAITGLSVNTVKAALRKGSRPNAYTFGAIAAAIGVEVRVPKNGIDVRAPRARQRSR